MSIEAMKLALESLEGINDEDRDKDFLTLKQFVRLDMAIEALRTAIQQAEAQQPSSKEHLFELWWEAHMPNATQEQAWTAFTAAVASNGVGIAASHPAPSVPDDVVRDAISTVREHYRGTDWGKAAESICDAIDAAMLAAK